GSMSYVVNSLNGDESRLFAVTQGNDPLQVTSLDPNQKFISTYYEPSEKLFYFNYIDEKGFFHNAATNFSDKNLEIFSSDYLDANTEIASVNNVEGRIYLFNAKNNNCFFILLKDKSLNNAKCESIKFNDQDELFSTNSNASGVYTTLIKGEI